MCWNICKLYFAVNVCAKKLKKLKPQELEDTSSSKKKPSSGILYENIHYIIDQHPRKQKKSFHTVYIMIEQYKKRNLRWYSFILEATEKTQVNFLVMKYDVPENDFFIKNCNTNMIGKAFS